ncbi:hypothetical protein [Kribbella sp. NPDC023855]|uniref:hypothetical protein n=1 Tax=Kribbella sp. NPDC023855 TaxID=3154698 RepID=UPI0033C0146C
MSKDRLFGWLYSMTTKKHRSEGLRVFAAFALLPPTAFTVPVTIIIDYLRPSPNLELFAVVYAVLLLVGVLASTALAAWVSVSARRVLHR